MSIQVKTFARNPLTVEAFQYNGENVALLPEWAKAHRGLTALGGVTPIGKDVQGQLLVPINGTVETVRYGDYLTFVPSPEGGTVAVFKKAIFEREFTLVEETLVASEAPAETVAEEPAAAAETTAPAKAGKGKAAAAETPAADAPAAEEPATEA